MCAARFDLEVEVRCVDCDAPLCPLCAVEVTSRRVTVCVPCGEAPGADEHGAEEGG